MYRSSKIIVAILFSAVAVYFFAGCSKGTSNSLYDADDNGGYASDLSRIELYTDDAISLCDAAGNFFNGKYMRTTTDTPNTFGTCATVAYDTATGTGVNQLIIRFGEAPCVCLDGRTRSGNIIVQYSGEYDDPNQTHTITFNNYYINGTQLTGTILTDRIDTTVVGNWYYRVNVLDTLVSSTSSNQPNTYTVWNATLVRQWITGFTTATRGDDIFSISGWGMLYRANLHQFEMTIATPLQVAMDCNFIESGVVDVSGLDGPRVLNYGNGSCDNQAQLNITDTTTGALHIYQISLTQ